MKVCLPILGDGGKEKELLANDFYKAQHYCIHNLKDNNFQIYSLNKTNSVYLSMSEMKKMGIQAIITPNLRPMAAKILFENEIEVYKAEGAEVKENISLYKKDVLKDFDATMVEQKSSCSSDSCSSCSSTSCN